MGQLFNRLIRFAKTQFQDDSHYHPSNYVDSPDNDLKKIIDELNNPKTDNSKQNSNKSNNNYNKNNNYANQNQKQDNNNYRMTIQDSFNTLGIKDNASIDEIKTAYKNKLKEYHPDKVAHLGSEIKELAEKKTKEIVQAYEILRKYKNF